MMLYDYNLKINTKQATDSIYSVYRDDAPEVRTFQNLFVRFRSGVYNLKDKKSTGRLIEAENFEEDTRGNPCRRSRRPFEWTTRRKPIKILNQRCQYQRPPF